MSRIGAKLYNTPFAREFVKLLNMKMTLKSSIHAFLALAFMSTISLGAELPEEAQRLIEIRKKAIEKIDEKFVDELEKIKTTYTKMGDLESANAILDLIENVALPMKTDVQFVGKWLFISGKWKGTRELRENGVCYSEGKRIGKWNMADQHLIINFDGGEATTFTLPIRDGTLSGRSSKGWGVQAQKIKFTR